MFLTFTASKVYSALRDQGKTPMAWERLDKRPEVGREIWSGKLKRALRRSGAGGAGVVHFKKEEFEMFKIQREIGPNDFIMVSAVHPVTYFRPMDTSSDNHESRFWNKLLPPEKMERLQSLKVVQLLRMGVRLAKSPFRLAVAAVVGLVNVWLRVLNFAFRKVGSILSAFNKQKHKVKIILSMFQVMDGIHMSFNLVLPLPFLQLMDNLNFIMFSLPLDCLVPVGCLPALFLQHLQHLQHLQQSTERPCFTATPHPLMS